MVCSSGLYEDYQGRKYEKFRRSYYSRSMRQTRRYGRFVGKRSFILAYSTNESYGFAQREIPDWLLKEEALKGGSICFLREKQLEEFSRHIIPRKAGWRSLHDMNEESIILSVCTFSCMEG